MEQAIIKIICDVTNIPIAHVKLDTKLVEDLFIDSLVFVKIITLIEEHLNINFPDELLELQEDVTVQELCEIVKKIL